MKKVILYICIAVFVIAGLVLIITGVSSCNDRSKLEDQQESITSEMNAAEQDAEWAEGATTAGIATILEGLSNGSSDVQEGGMIPKYEVLYEQNDDLIGWLSIEGTKIDYPVMQTPENENYYLNLGFDKKPNENGSLIMDTDSEVGIGTVSNQYADGVKPCSNLIIHGHTMKSGEMFGDLDLYKDEAYGMEHNIIRFDSLYEEREYELIAVFYSQVFYQHEDVFKYYKFFQADTEEEFFDWYNNIKKMSVYDTGVTAEFGDEFITLSACAYHVEDGRFVVVGRRIK